MSKEQEKDQPPFRKGDICMANWGYMPFKLDYDVHKAENNKWVYGFRDINEAKFRLATQEDITKAINYEKDNISRYQKLVDLFESFRSNVRA